MIDPTGGELKGVLVVKNIVIWCLIMAKQIRKVQGKMENTVVLVYERSSPFLLFFLKLESLE